MRFIKFTEDEKKQLSEGKIHGTEMKELTERATAMVYVMTAENARQGRPSEEYFETIAEGYERFGFDRGILESAVKGCSEYLDS